MRFCAVTLKVPDAYWVHLLLNLPVSTSTSLTQALTISHLDDRSGAPETCPHILSHCSLWSFLNTAARESFSKHNSGQDCLVHCFTTALIGKTKTLHVIYRVSPGLTPAKSTASSAVIFGLISTLCFFHMLFLLLHMVFYSLFPPDRLSSRSHITSSEPPSPVPEAWLVPPGYSLYNP